MFTGKGFLSLHGWGTVDMVEPWETDGSLQSLQSGQAELSLLTCPGPVTGQEHRRGCEGPENELMMHSPATGFHSSGSTQPSWPNCLSLAVLPTGFPSHGLWSQIQTSASCEPQVRRRSEKNSKGRGHQNKDGFWIKEADNTIQETGTVRTQMNRNWKDKPAGYVTSNFPRTEDFSFPGKEVK